MKGITFSKAGGPFGPFGVGNGEIIFPCHTGSNTGSNVPCTVSADEICSAGLGHGVYKYVVGSGFHRVGNSSCSTGGSCSTPLAVDGEHKHIFDTIAAFDPERRYYCCCKPSNLVAGTFVVEADQDYLACLVASLGGVAVKAVADRSKSTGGCGATKSKQAGSCDKKSKCGKSKKKKGKGKGKGNKSKNRKGKNKGKRKKNKK